MTITRSQLEYRLSAQKAQSAMIRAIQELQHANAALVARALAAEQRAADAERHIRDMNRLNWQRQGMAVVKQRYSRRLP